jgi:hypothetical protein
MRINNYRPYVTAGVYGAVDLGRKKGEALLFKQMDYGLTVGLGSDFYFSFFKLSPELKFYFGLPNMIINNRTDLTDPAAGIYYDALSKATTRMIILTFNFE